MRNIRKKIMILLIVMALIGAAQRASAEIDGRGDVYHHKASSDGKTWVYEQTSSGKEEVDIKEISYSVSGSTLTITFEVYGDIQTSSKHAYIFYYNTSDATYYFIYSTIGSAIGEDWDYHKNPDDFDPMEILDHMVTGTLTKEGSTLTGTIELLGSSEPVNIWGSAIEYNVQHSEEMNIGSVEWYGDYLPNSYAPWHSSTNGGDDTGGDDTGGDDNGGENPPPKPDTPGFEMLAVILAIGIALIILKRRK